MAKKRKRDSSVAEADEDEGGFSISKTRMGKPELKTTAVNLTVEQTEHLTAVAKANDTSRAEFVRQALDYCLNQIGEPFPD